MWVPDESAGAGPPTLDQIAEVAPSPSIFSRLLSGAADVGGTLLYPLTWTDAAARKLAGGVLGTQATEGTQYPGLGTVPSGQDIARQALGLKPNDPTAWEWSDVPGIIAELGLSPANFVGVGELSGLGKLAKEAKSLEALTTAAKAARPAGAALTAAETADLSRLAALNAKLGASGAYGATMGDQARQGYRSLLSVGLPFTEGMPVLRGAPALDVIGQAAAFTGKYSGLNKLYDATLRPGGRIGGENAARFNPNIDVVQDSVRAAQHEASQAGIGVGNALDKLAPNAESSLANIVSQLTPSIDAEQKILQASLNYPARKSVDIALKRFNPLTGIDEVAADSGAAHAIADLAVQYRDVATTRTPQAVAEWTRQLAKKNAAYTQRIADATAAGDDARAIALQAAQTRMQRQIADMIAIENATGRKADLVMQTIQKESPQLHAEAERVGLMMDEDLAKSQRVGIRAPSLSDMRLSYLPRRLTAEGQAFAAASKEPIFNKMSRLWASEAPYTKQRVRSLDGMSSFQVEKMARDAGFTGQSFLVHDLGDLVQQRLMEGGVSRAHAQFLQGVLETGMVSNGLAGPGAMPVADYLEKIKLTRTSGGLTGAAATDLPKKARSIARALKGTPYEGMSLPADIAGAALKATERLQPTELRNLVNAVDKVHAAIRFGVTQPFPAFHVRNLIGNVFMMGLAGMRNPVEMAQLMGESFNSVMRMRMGGESGIETKWVKSFVDNVFGKSTPAERSAFRDAVQFGSATTGLSTEGTQLARGETLFQGAAKLLGKTPVAGPTLNKISAGMLKAGGFAQDMGSIIEDASKLAMYKWGLKQGMSPSSAGAMVKKYLFDYGDLGSFEKRYMRRAVYFWTYARKSIPLLVGEMIEHPYVLDAYGKATGMDQGSRQQQLLPDFRRRQGLVDIGNDAQGNAKFLRPDLPLSQLFQFSDEGRGPRRLAQTVAQNLAPIPRGLTEFLSGTNLQTGRPVQGGAEQAFTGMLPTTRLTSTVNRLLESGDNQTGSTTKMINVLNSALLGLPQIHNVDPTRGASFVKSMQIQAALERLANSGRAFRRLDYTPKEKDEAVRRLLSMQQRNAR